MPLLSAQEYSPNINAETREQEEYSGPTDWGLEMPNQWEFAGKSAAEEGVAQGNSAEVCGWERGPLQVFDQGLGCMYTKQAWA